MENECLQLSWSAFISEKSIQYFFFFLLNIRLEFVIVHALIFKKT